MKQPLLPQIWDGHPYYSFSSSVDKRVSTYKIFHGKEALFYVLIGMLLLFALLRAAFAKYVSDLFRVFFRTTMKQRQIRDQLMQAPLPSMMFNLFFVATGGLYLTFLLFSYFQFKPVSDFWLFYLYAVAALVVIYTVKYVALKVVGWIFSVVDAADSYIFIVFIINKVIGIYLLPFLILLAFASDPVYSTALILSWIGLGCLYVYRFVLGMAAARSEVKFNPFHFLIFVAAFEVAPLYLLYKLLLLRV